MRDLHHYLDLFAGTDRVGRQLLARAIHVARHGPDEVADPTVEDIASIARSLGDEDWTTPSDLARQRLLLEAACAELADPDDGRDQGRTALADRLGVSYGAVKKWLAGERALKGPALKMVQRIVGVKS